MIPLTGKDPEARFLVVIHHLDGRFNKDLEAAGIAKQNPRGKVVFHSLCTAVCTLIDQDGATPAEGQAMARHASLQMTYGIYTKIRKESCHPFFLLAPLANGRFVAKTP